MNSEFVVRPARERHVRDIVQLIANGGADAHFNPDLGIDREYIEQCRQSDLSQENMAKWHERVAVQDSGQLINVALNGLGRVVGMHYSTMSGERRGSLRCVYVLNEYRGGGVGGVAQGLTNHALEWLGNDRDLDVMIATYNMPSRRFHERNGFTEPGDVIKMGKIPVQLWFRRAESTEDA